MPTKSFQDGQQLDLGILLNKYHSRIISFYNKSPLVIQMPISNSLSQAAGLAMPAIQNHLKLISHS